jgi:hypothetical protein
MITKLNIPKKINESKFSSVDFVESMSTFQLKTLIKNMWENMGELANTMDANGRSDVATVIDRMREGNTWSVNQLRDRFRFARHGSTIMVYDLVNDTFRLLDESGHTVTYDAMNQKELSTDIKDIAKGTT